MDQSIKFTPARSSTGGPRRVMAISVGIAAIAAVALAGSFVLLPGRDRAPLLVGPLPMLPDTTDLVARPLSRPWHVPAYVPPSSPPAYLASQALADREGTLTASAASLDAAASRLAEVAGRLATLTDQMAARLPPADAEAPGGQVGATARAVALDSAAMDDPGLLQWTVSALVASYTYNYHDQAGQMAAARLRFSRAGQDGADGPFGPSMDHETAVRDRWLCHAQADRAAAVLEKGVVLDVLRYDVEVPVVQTCEHDTGDFTHRFRVRALVVRTGELDHPEGVMIDRVEVTKR